MQTMEQGTADQHTHTHTHTAKKKTKNAISPTNISDFKKKKSLTRIRYVFTKLRDFASVPSFKNSFPLQGK